MLVVVIVPVLEQTVAISSIEDEDEKENEEDFSSTGRFDRTPQRHGSLDTALKFWNTPPR